MKIAIGTGLFTEGDVDVDSGHLAKIRYKNKIYVYDDIFLT